MKIILNKSICVVAINSFDKYTMFFKVSLLSRLSKFIYSYKTIFSLQYLKTYYKVVLYYFGQNTMFLVGGYCHSSDRARLAFQ
jgi:hypothetical protein